jgi:hypothetical protein
VVAIIMGATMAAEDLLCAMTMTSPLMMLFVQSLLLGMPLLKLARDSGSMSLGASLLRGSHSGRNRNGGNDSGGRLALRKDDDIATDDALCSGHPIWHAPAELARDSGSMSLGTSLLRGSHSGSNPRRRQKICFAQG